MSQPKPYAEHIQQVVAPDIHAMNNELKLKIQNLLGKITPDKEHKPEMERLLGAALTTGADAAEAFSMGISLTGDDPKHALVREAAQTLALAVVYEQLQARQGKSMYPTAAQVCEDRRAAGAPMDPFFTTEDSSEIREFIERSRSNLEMVLRNEGVNSTDSVARNLIQGARRGMDAALKVGGRPPGS